MESQCQEGKYGCKYSGDLYEICPKYRQGSTKNGEPILERKDFPHHCRDCEDRDFDFCLRFKDLICFNGQDPFDCKMDLLNDELHGIALGRKLREAMREAFLKREIPYKET